MEICKKNVQNYLAKTNGRYLKLGELKSKYQSYRLAGVVVHDEVEVFDEAVNEEVKNEYKWKIEPIRVGKRFQARVVSQGRRYILLIGTGMGCTGSSIVVYELGLQHPKVRILKVGTCVSTWQSDKVGTILVPRWAIADEGVTELDGRVLGRSHGQQREIEEVFKNKNVVSADQTFREEWNCHLHKHIDKLNKLNGTLADDDTVVWSADAFYPLLLRSDFVEYFAEGHAIRLRNVNRGWTKVRKIRQKVRVKNREGWERLAAWDMECAALFSAGQVLGLEVAAGLVVSWSSEHWRNIAKCSTDTRDEIDDKELAHKIEHVLVLEAILYLFKHC